MFNDVGTEEMRIEDVAAAAGLSGATFYYYFRPKVDILLSSLTEETEQVLAHTAPCIVASYPDAITGFDALGRGSWSQSFTSMSRQMWRIAVSQTMLDPQSKFCRRYVVLDNRLSDQLCLFVSMMQAAGHIKPEIDSEAVGALLFINKINMNVLAYTRSDLLKVARHCDAQSVPFFKLIACQGYAL